jgi:hypothetical protein
VIVTAGDQCFSYSRSSRLSVARSTTLPHLDASSAKAILRGERVASLRSDGSICAADGASGSHGQLYERGIVPTPNMVRLRVGIQYIIPC